MHRSIFVLVTFMASCAQSPSPKPERFSWEPPVPSNNSESVPEAPKEPEVAKEQVTPGEPDPEIARLFAEANKQYLAGDKDGAKITLHQALERDAGHLGANESYQDIMLGEDKASAVIETYRKRLAGTPTDCVAMYLYLRPILLDRRVTEVNRDQLSDVIVREASELYGQALDHFEARDWPACLGTLHKLFEKLPMHIAGHRLFQDATVAAVSPQDRTAAIEGLRRDYKKLLVDHETDGDARYLYERAETFAAGEAEMQASMLRYAEDVRLGLPGYWLYYGLGHLAREWALKKGLRRDREALLRLSEIAYTVCVTSEPLIEEGFFGRGVARHDRLDFQGAAQDYALVLALVPVATPEVYELLGKAHASLGEQDKSLEAYRAGAKKYPKLALFPINMGALEEVRGNVAAAVVHYRGALALLDPADPAMARLAERITALEAAPEKQN